jgi:uncharacterized protein
VYIEEVPSGVHIIIGVATSITAFVDRAPRGPVDSNDKSPAHLQLADCERSFGGLSGNSPYQQRSATMLPAISAT